MQARLLKKVPLFEGLSDAELDALAQVTFIKRFPKGSVILLAEEEGDSMFIIDKGKVKVTIVSEDGREVILDLLKTGDFFGEMSLLDGRPRSATVIAMEDSEVLLLRRGDLLDLIRRIPQIATKLLAELTTRLRKADQKIESLALLDVVGRICGTLMQLAEEQGVQTPQGILIQGRPTHQELANMSGTTRETVSRVLKRLENEGYIASDGREVLILRPDEMRHGHIVL